MFTSYAPYPNVLHGWFPPHDVRHYKVRHEEPLRPNPRYLTPKFMPIRKTADHSITRMPSCLTKGAAWSKSQCSKIIANTLLQSACSVTYWLRFSISLLFHYMLQAYSIVLVSSKFGIANYLPSQPRDTRLCISLDLWSKKMLNIDYLQCLIYNTRPDLNIRTSIRILSHSPSHAVQPLFSPIPWDMVQQISYVARFG